MAQATPASITIAGNVTGNIIAGDNNFVVNTNHGTIIYKEAAPRVQLRSSSPLAPRNPRGFFGREQELGQLEAWIAARESIWISGKDGIGKTSLAKRAGNGQAASTLSNGVLYLEGVDEAGTLLGFGDMVQRMFDTLFESDPPLKVDLAAARSYLSNTRPLVLLSGVSIAREALNRLPDLFPAAPILVETDQPPYGDIYQTLALGPLEAEDGLALLAEHAGLALDVKNRPILAEIADLLGNVPAALVMIGNAFLGRRLIPEMTAGLLRGIQPAASDPVESEIERAYRVLQPALSDTERGILAQAAAAPGLSVDRHWMEGKFGEDAVASAETLGLLTANSPRLRLAAGMRKMSLEGQDQDGLKEALYNRLAEELKDRWLDFEYVGSELGNLLGLLEWAAESGRYRIAVYLAQVLDPYLTLRGLWEARGAALHHLMRAATALQDLPTQGWAMHQLGVQHVGAGELQPAREMFQQARDLRLSLGDAEGAAYSQHNLDLLGPPPPPSPPQQGSRGGGRPSPWARALLFGTLGVGAVLALIAGGTVLAGRLPIFRPTDTARPTATETPTASATATASPTASVTATASPTSTPDLLGWEITPVFSDVSDQGPKGCQITLLTPRIVGTENQNVLGFNRIVEEFEKADTRRAADDLARRFGGETCQSAGSGWADDYRITTWPDINFMDIKPMEIFADSAIYPSSDNLLSVLLLSIYTAGDFSYPPLTSSITYDLNLGKELTLSDLFLPDASYLARISDYAYNDLVSQGLSSENAKFIADPNPDHYQTWNLTYFGLLMTFNAEQNGFTQLEIPNQQVLIPYKALVDIINPSGPIGEQANP